MFFKHILSENYPFNLHEMFLLYNDFVRFIKLKYFYSNIIGQWYVLISILYFMTLSIK